MKTRNSTRWIYAAPLLAALTAMAQSEEPPANRFSLSYRAGFNLKADFKNLGSGVAGGPSVTGLSYEDGFVRPNSEPNDLDLSWNWSYESAGQIVGDNLVLTRSQSGDLGGGDADEPANGLELAYGRLLGRWGKSRWGLEGALNYTALSMDQSSGSALKADAFSLGGTVPPAAPYAGSPGGPGPLISTVPSPATIHLRNKLEADVVGLRLGPYWELPLCRRAALSLSGGFALAWVHSDYSFRESATVGGSTGETRSDATSDDDWLPGWYVGGNILINVSRAVGLFAGAQFQDVGDVVLRAGDKQATLDLGQSIFVSAGLCFSF